MYTIKIVQTLVHTLLTVVIVLFIITGFGISNYQIVTSLTGNVLSKINSYQIHTTLIIPFIVLLMLHIGFTVGKKFKKEI
jgi:hypothetical protein